MNNELWRRKIGVAHTKGSKPRLEAASRPLKLSLSLMGASPERKPFSVREVLFWAQTNEETGCIVAQIVTKNPVCSLLFVFRILTLLGNWDGLFLLEIETLAF